MEGVKFIYGDMIDGTYKIVEETHNKEWVQDIRTNNRYHIWAIKEKEGGKERIGKEYNNKLYWLSQLDHPHFVKLIKSNEAGILKRGDVETPIKYYITELYSTESMMSLMFALGDGVQENIAQYYFLQLLSALSHAHCKGISIRHLHSMSIHFTPGCKAVVNDYRHISHKSKDKAFGKPQLPEGEEYLGAPADVFMVANALRGMVFNKLDFGRDGFGRSKEYLVLGSNYTHQFFANVIGRGIIEYIPESLQQILVLCLQPDPALRPSIGELTQHEWAMEANTSYKEVQDWMDALAFITRQDKERFMWISDQFTSFIDKNNKRQLAAVNRQYMDAEYGIECKDKGWQCFLTDKPEQLFNGLSAYNQHNAYFCWINEFKFEMKIKVNKTDDFTIDICICPYTAHTYIVALLTVFKEYHNDPAFKSYWDKMCKYLGPLVTHRFNEQVDGALPCCVKNKWGMWWRCNLIAKHL